MIEDIMDICTEIINNYSGDWSKINRFVIHTIMDIDHNGHISKPFVQIEGLNRSHTTMFKIRAKQSDIGLIFKYPCIYEGEDALLRKWKLKRIDLNNIRDKSYWDLLTFGDVFDTEYDSFDCSDLKKLLRNYDCGQIEIRNNNCNNIYSAELLRNVVIDYDLEDIGLKLIHQNAPLRINYKWGIFDVYCLIAPRLEVKEDRFYLRV